MRVLLVDDHEVVRRGVRELLTEQYPDAQFGEAGTLPAARDALAREGWDLMLLDINLPGGSGLELLARARRLCPRMAVLMLSAYPEEEFAVRAFRLGADGYLTKSSVAEEMLLAVGRVIAGVRYVSIELADRLAATLGNPLAQAPHEALSPRELEVMRLVAVGRTIKEIAANLGLSEKTIATYRARVSEKLGVSTNVELARYALKNGLVD
jgi:DNA-binding NarL/FixJ family response regulator